MVKWAPTHMREVPPRICEPIVINRIDLGTFYLWDPACIQGCRTRIDSRERIVDLPSLPFRGKLGRSAYSS